MKSVLSFLENRDAAGLAEFLDLPLKDAANAVHRYDVAQKIKNEDAAQAILRHLEFLREFLPRKNNNKNTR